MKSFHRSPVPLADALVDLLPHEAEKHLEHVNEPWGDLVRVRLWQSSEMNGVSLRSRGLLEKCDELIVDEGPEWQSQRALAWAAYLRGRVSRNRQQSFSRF